MHKTLISVTTASLFLAGCAGMSETQKNTATGAGVGAVAGALISAATGGHAGTGAAVGAGVGALGTYIWSSNLEKQRRDMQAPEHQRRAHRQASGRRRAFGPRDFVGFRQFGQDRARAIEIASPRIRRHDRAGRPVKQARSQPCLKPGD